MRRFTMTRGLVAALTVLLAGAAGVSAGPPWIAVEVPANPHHPSTRDALMLVRAYHHSTAVAFPLTARAEGLIDGRRVSVPLEIERTAQAGLFAVRGSPGRDGVWVVVVSLKEGTSSATALIALDGEGRVGRVDVPSDRSRDGWIVPRAVTEADIDAALRSAARVAGGGGSAWSRGGLVATVPAGLILLLGLAAIRRRLV